MHNNKLLCTSNKNRDAYDDTNNTSITSPDMYTVSYWNTCYILYLQLKFPNVNANINQQHD